MSFPWRSRFVYGTGGDVVDWTTTLPVRAWDRVTPTVGGARTAAGGTPAAHVVRRDENLVLTLRIFESEWPDLHALVRWGQLAETFTWYPDADDEATSFVVWLEDPQAGASLAPGRSTEYPRVLEVAITLRSQDANVWTLEYFAAPQ
jgi:hypothetical protein